MRRSILSSLVGSSTFLFAAVAASSPASAALFPGSFEASEGFTPGDVQGQQGWSYPGNSFTGGAVVAAPAGTPVQLGSQSLLLSTRDAAFNGVLTGVVSPPVGPYGIPGSKVGGVNGSGPTEVGNVYEGDFWFRTAAADAASSGIGDGAFFFQVNLSSRGERFGRVALFQLNGSSIDVITDPYRTYDTNTTDAGGDESDVPDLAIASDLEFGQWYRLHSRTEFNTVTQNGDFFVNNDVLTAEIFDAAGNSLGSRTDSSTWMAAWVATPGGFNDANAGHYAIDSLNFLNRGAVPNNAPSMYIDNVFPEPGAIGLLALGGLGLLARRRRR